MRILFASDLDNTLLHSFHHKKDGDVCVEYKNEKEQGYVTKYVYDNFPVAIKDLIFVPVTCRSIEQVKRIGFFDQFAKCIISSNGGRLLINGVEDEKWSKETSLIVEKELDEFDKLAKKSSKDNKYFKNTKVIDNTYYALFTNEGVDAKGILLDYQKETSLVGMVSKRKIYFTPKGIDKGVAVKKLKEKYAADLIISAGDSALDYAMLNVSDIAIVPNEEVKSCVTAKKIIVNDTSDRFCDFVIKKIIELTKEYDL